MDYRDDLKKPEEVDFPSSGFATTHWTAVLQAAGASSEEESARALEELCRNYWMPLYAYARRRLNDPHQAQDATQNFFAALLEKDFLLSVDPAKGRFRAFLLTAMKRSMANARDKQSALKRGGGQVLLCLEFDRAERHYRHEPADTETPEQIFQRDWARALLTRVLQRLRDEYEQKGKAAEFDALKAFITPHRERLDVSSVAKRLGRTESAVRTAAHRLRQRYRVLLRQEVAHTVADPAEIEDEIRSLFAVFS